MFHRLYVKPYNAFIDMCPAGFKPVLDGLGIVSSERKVNRRSMIVFEATDEIARSRNITEADGSTIVAHKHNVIEFIVKVSTMYKDYPTLSLEPYEAWLLRGWLKIDLAYYVPVSYDGSAL